MRRYPAWYHHVNLALVAYAYLTVARAAAPDSPDLLPQTVPEARRQLCRLIWAPTAPAEPVLACRAGASPTRLAPAAATTGGASDGPAR